MARPRPGPTLAAAATIAVLATVAAGLFLIENPTAERGRRIDAQRVQDLDALAHAIDCHWTLQHALPPDLDTLASRMARLSGERPIDGRCVPARMTDPETDDPYRYRILSGSTFELCATFAEPSPNPPAAAAAPGSDIRGDAARAWIHGAGAQCFSLAATGISVIP